ncbi:hypothetical protein N431DRAFT_463661 [Stipitochalara longipes BDJ]|nr:hypothetical protein N431DRAFT_463661 [Stipitochalara longipes BDJ]
MVQGKKANEMSNGTNKYQQSNMAFQRNNVPDSRGGSAGKSDGKPQNGNANFFRTDTAISGAKGQGERPLQRWVDDGPATIDGSLESGRNSKSTGGTWDQFAENERRFGLKTDYDENIYTMPINKNDPQYKQKVAAADKIAREIEHSVATNSHVAEERIIDNVGGDDGVDEEEKYSGVRRQQDFPPLGSTNNKYTPPARRAPTGQATVSGAPVDPAIISSQLARPDKPAAERPKPTTAAKASKPEVATPPTTTESSFSATPETKATLTTTPSSSSRTASPQVKAEGVPNATATVERDVTNAFKTFATRERRVVENARMTKAKNDKEIKLNDLKKFADSFKLHTPVPSDLVPIIAKDPAKQKEIQEKARRNAEELKAQAPEAAKPVAAVSDATKPAQRPTPAQHSTSSTNLPNRQNPGRNSAFVQGAYNPNQSFNNRGSSQTSQPQPSQTNRPTGNLGARLRNLEQNKHNQMPLNPIPVHETRLPPTGPANNVDPNFSRRSSGVASVGPAARLNPNSIEFRPSPNAPSFSPNGNPSTGSSPRSAVNTTAPTPVTRSLLKRKPLPEGERPSIKGKFNALEHIKTLKPGQGKDWKATGGIKPAYDTPPVFRQLADDEKEDSTMRSTYAKTLEAQHFPAQTVSPSNPSHAIPQVPHQHQLPFHLQQGVHNNMASRQSPRQPPMNLHNNQHVHGPTPPFNGHDEHRMMPSHSAQSYASPRLQNVPMAYPSPMNQNAQLAFPPQMMPYAGAPPMQPQLRSFSQSHQFMPQQGQMGPIMMPNPAGSFLTSQGMAPGPQMMYQQGAQGPFMPPHNGPPAMPANGFPSPGRGAPMMMNQGSQQGHQQPMYGMNPGMSPGPQYVAPMYPQQPPGQMPMRGYGGPNQFGTSPQQMHQYGPPQHRNNHPNGSYNGNKNFPQHGQHPNGPTNNQIPTGPQARPSEVSEETK